jgi:hypothetical protein
MASRGFSWLHLQLVDVATNSVGLRFSNVDSNGMRRFIFAKYGVFWRFSHNWRPDAGRRCVTIVEYGFPMLLLSSLSFRSRRRFSNFVLNVISLLIYGKILRLFAAYDDWLRDAGLLFVSIVPYGISRIFGLIWNCDLL